MHFARSIVDQQERLTETIDAAGAGRSGTARLAADPRSDRAANLAGRCGGDAQVRAQAAGVQVRIGSVPDMRVQGDAYLLRQALHNLIDNAIAFSPPGADIALLAEVDGQGVRLQVADRGAGIPDYARERVFERFYSLARPGSGRRSSGLGLPFVQEVARLHDGRASADARDGGGTVASLWLPLGTPGQRPRR